MSFILLNQLTPPPPPGARYYFNSGDGASLALTHVSRHHGSGNVSFLHVLLLCVVRLFCWIHFCSNFTCLYVEVIGLNYRTIDKIDTNAIDKSQSISYLLLYLSEIDALFTWGGYVHCPFSGKWINQNRNLYASPTTAFNNKVLHHHYE